MLLSSSLSLSAFVDDAVILLFRVDMMQLIHVYFTISNYFYFSRKLFLIQFPTA